MQGEIPATQSMRMFIGGERVQSAAGETITGINLADREPLSEFPRGKEADVDRAVEAARRAFEGDRMAQDGTGRER